MDHAQPTGPEGVDHDATYAAAMQLLAAGSDADGTRGEEMLAGCAAAGHLGARWRLAERLLAATDPQRRGQGVTWLRAAAEGGHSRAAFRLGLLYRTGGDGLAVDPISAAQWCRRAAEAGLGEAQFNLGMILATGEGLPADRADAERWLRLAAINGIAEAEGCLDLLAGADGRPERPRTWEEAETRASVALVPSDGGTRKSMRFAEYYIDPCLDLLLKAFRLDRERSEDIIQQFFCELEEPLSKGRNKGAAWKAALRGDYERGRGQFRPFLRRALLNFTHDWLRRETPAAAPPAEKPDAEVDDVVDHHAEAWRAMLARFRAEVAGARPAVARAVGLVCDRLAEGLEHAELCRRSGLSERTVRNEIRLGAELLHDWLAGLCAGVADHDQLRTGIDLLPGWLHHAQGSKRARVLLLLALVHGRLGGRAG